MIGIFPEPITYQAKYLTQILHYCPAFLLVIVGTPHGKGRKLPPYDFIAKNFATKLIKSPRVLPEDQNYIKVVSC